MTIPMLSICIPTYNRAEYLDKSLCSLICQKRFNEIEVVISDNCSTDHTEEIVKKYQTKHGNIFYHKNSENILDENFPTVLMKAHGLYRKVFNDNCIYHEGTLVRIFNHIEKYKDSDKKPFIFFLNLGSPKMKEQIFIGESMSDFARTVGFRTTWIGGFGLWKEECEDLHEEFSYCETKLWQTYKAYKLVSQKKYYLISNEPLVTVMNMKKRDRSYGLYTVFYKNFLSLLEPYLISNELSKDDMYYIRKDMLYYQFADFVFQIKKDNTVTDYGCETDYRKKIIKEYKHEPYYLTFLFWYLWNYKICRYFDKPKQLFKKTFLGQILLKIKHKLLK